MYPPPLRHNKFSQSNKQHSVNPDGSPLRLYQVWKGRNRFVFGGRLIFGPDVKSIFITLLLILIPVILFWTFVATDLINALLHGWGILILVISIILTVYIVILLLLTSGSDPGIIPRNSQPPDPDDCDTSSLSTDWAGSQSSSHPGIPMTKNVTINGIIVKVKYCQTCMLYRPPRCSHCSICNNCVDRFDHHCPWVGQCIGKRNYRYFFMFVSSTSLLCLHVLVCSLINITRIMNKYDCSFWKAIQKSPASGILVMYTFVVCWFVGGLTTFHLYLIATNQTTYENFRYQYDRKMNPYNLGFSRNCQQVFCSKIPSSRNNFRARIEADSSFGFSTSPYSSRIRPDKPIRSFDLEMERRQGVDCDDLNDIRNRATSLGRLERCSTEPRRNDWEHRIDWGISPDKSMYTPDLQAQIQRLDQEKGNIDQ